jgi:hypothetical protein
VKKVRKEWQGDGGAVPQFKSPGNARGQDGGEIRTNNGRLLYVANKIAAKSVQFPGNDWIFPVWAWFDKGPVFKKRKCNAYRSDPRIEKGPGFVATFPAVP